MAPSRSVQQPIDAILRAARQGRQAGALVVADVLAGEQVQTPTAAAALANHVLRNGPALVAPAISGVGDLLVWRGGSRLFPISDTPVIDRTGAGDAFMAGLIAALRRDADPVQAGHFATAAASATGGHLGGRPHLDVLRHA